MAVLNPVASTGTLRERFTADMAVRGFSANTQHQMETSYAELSESENESDREQVRACLATLVSILEPK